MNETAAHIHSSAQVDWLGRTIDTHWNVHAIVMITVWILLVPVCITVMRFHKPPPSEKGIRRDVSIWHGEWPFFSIHKFGLFFATLMPPLFSIAVSPTVQRWPISHDGSWTEWGSMVGTPMETELHRAEASN